MMEMTNHKMIHNMNNVLSGIGIRGYCVTAETHRHQAFYDVRLEAGSSFRKLRNRKEDIALGIQSKTTPIIKAIPERGIVRIQAPIRDADILPFEDLCRKEECPTNYTLPFMLGETNEGKTLWIDFAKNPHLLIAGGTGSGKSVLLHNLINNALWLHANNIRDMNVYLVDPKRVEFNAYKDPALGGVISGVFNDYVDTVKLLRFIEALMESRYSTMAARGISSIEEDPRLFTSTLVIIDELADLMLQDKRTGTLQNLLVSIAQKARAAGIYLVAATQRPSTDVLTGLIKANFPGRIACKTASGIDSKVVLDMTGAENLLGRGDAILRNMVFDSERFQVAFSTAKKSVELFKKVYWQ